jgi:hypothetical protein
MSRKQAVDPDDQVTEPATVAGLIEGNRAA